MKKQITHVSIFQSSKVLAILACILSIIIAVPLGIYALIEGNNDTAVAFFLQPLLHLAVSFITSIVVFFIYNQLTKVLGGIELETSE